MGDRRKCNGWRAHGASDAKEGMERGIKEGKTEMAVQGRVFAHPLQNKVQRGPEQPSKKQYWRRTINSKVRCSIGTDVRQIAVTPGQTDGDSA